jgi:hypothetical protein
MEGTIVNITHRATLRALAVVGAMALVGANAAIAGAKPGGVAAVPLNVGQEVTGSNTGAHGSFSYTIEGDELCYTLSVTNLSGPAIGAHIHIGPRRVAGPIVVPLDTGAGTSWTVQECIIPTDENILDEITADTRNYYVNVHTDLFPGGEVRGQLK